MLILFSLKELDFNFTLHNSKENSLSVSLYYSLQTLPFDRKGEQVFHAMQLCFKARKITKPLSIQNTTKCHYLEEESLSTLDVGLKS